MHAPEPNIIAINAIIAGRSYRLKINAHQEEHIRKAIKAADKKILDLQQVYAGTDAQDFVAMCLITYVIENAESTESTETNLPQTTLTSTQIEPLQSIEDTLNQALES